MNAAEPIVPTDPYILKIVSLSTMLDPVAGMLFTAVVEVHGKTKTLRGTVDMDSLRGYFEKVADAT